METFNALPPGSALTGTDNTLAPKASTTDPLECLDMSAPEDSSYVSLARNVLLSEAEAIVAMSRHLTTQFDQAIELLYRCNGKVVVTGMGKSGHIGLKIAATLASTGTPAFFVHPAELRHGDFGMLDERDLVVAVSGSGETQEIKLVLDPIKRLGINIVAMTGNKDSTLARFADAILDVGVAREACPFNLAPTSSTTAALAMGDALAIVLMTRKKFCVEDYARAHPGGFLGQRLVTVQNIMRPRQALPSVELESTYKAVLTEIDKKRLGFTAVCDASEKLVGIITDGDIRRALVKAGQAAFEKKAVELMSPNPKTISITSLAVEALRLMEKHEISDLLIVDDERRPIGLIHLKDLLRAGII